MINKKQKHLDMYCKRITVITVLLNLQACFGNYWGMKKNDGMKNKETKIVGKNPRSMQEKCPKMTLWMSCSDYYFSIWDGDGEYFYDSLIDGLDLDICYDPTQCYMFEMYSYSDECDYRITMEGKVMKEENMIYDTFRIGACDDPCPGKQQIHILTYRDNYYEYGDMDYTFHRPGQGDIDGTIIEGNGVSYCLDIDQCNLIALAKAGYPYYVIFDGDGALIDDGEFEFTKTFGNCEFNCTDTTLLISTNEMNGDLNITFGLGLGFTNEILLGGQVKTVCIDKTKCSIINGKGKANYYFLRNSEVYEIGLPSEYRYFGQCKKECTKRPLLDETERGLHIVSRLATVSGMAKLADSNSARYQAACWLIHDDIQQYAADDDRLVQRYVLSLIYLTTGGHNWTSPLGFMTGKHECDWSAVYCTNQLVTKLNLESNNLSGTIVSEIYSLYHLEFLSLWNNHMHGSIPFGIDRLSLNYINLNTNDFTGTIPEDILIINGLEYLDLAVNLFTGYVPQKHGDLSTLTYIYLEGNFLSGTIPNWITEAPTLKQIHLNLNNLSGNIPQNWNLEKIVIIHLNNNQLTGTVPSELFSLPSLEALSISTNKLSGPIQFPKKVKKTSLGMVKLNSNKFSGTISSDIAKLRKLKKLYLKNNQLSGAIPKEIESLKRINYLRMENNNFNGTIPFDNCDNFEVLSADCSDPRNIICPCCTRCFGYFTINEDVLPCLSSILSMNLLSYPNYVQYDIVNEDNQLIYEYSYYTTGVIRSCISPTDCMAFNTGYQYPFSVTVDDNIVFHEGSEWHGTKELFGYASDGTMKSNTCDAYKICDRSLLPGTPQRKLFNLITRFSGLDIFKGPSKQYKSLCWWLDDLDSMLEPAQDSTLNLQRYILALLYVSTGGDEWINNEKWMSSGSECEWYGISCDSFEGMIDGIDLSNNNLKGFLLSELGELRGVERLILRGNALQGSMPVELVKLKYLKTLDLSRNRLGGTIHEEIHFLENLEILDFSVNRFSSTLPSEIGLLNGLHTFNIAQNGISGIFPIEICNVKMLQFISVKQNLMHGDLDLIDGLTDLEHIDFSDNYFTGSLPLFGKSQHKLRVVRLNNNLFSGGIPPVIEEITSLNELLIYSNKITGSLPSQLGKIKDMSSMSVAYNLLKGTIPTEISSMRNLTLLHLHENGLSGDLNHFNYSISSFISDCGSTEVSGANIICLNCTECCNDDGDCITVADTWPKSHMKSMNVSAVGIVLLFIITSSLVLSLIFTIIGFLETRLPQLPFSVYQRFEEKSIYRWFLSSYKMAWFIATISVLFQTWLAYIFLRAGDIRSGGNLWVYSKDCPNNGTDCTSHNQTNLVGWLTFAGVVAAFLMKDFFSGCLMFYESSLNFNMRGVIAGMVLINITTLSIVASAVFLYATSVSNISLIQDAVIVLFLNDVDDKILMMFQAIVPMWTDNVESNITLTCANALGERDKESEVTDKVFNDDSEDKIENCDGVRHDVPQGPRDEEQPAANDTMNYEYEHDLVNNCNETLERKADNKELDSIKGNLKFVMAELNAAKEENAEMRKDYEKKITTMKKDNEKLKERLQRVEGFIQSLQHKC